jgi:FkbM family methyltransferase
MVRIPKIAKTFIRKAAFKPGRRVHTVRSGALSGWRLMLDLQHDTQVWRGVYEQDLQSWLVDRVKPGAVCIDVGAAEGVFTVLMSKLAGTAGHIFAFEPGNRGEQIHENLELNRQYPLAKVEVIQAFAGAPDAPAAPGTGIATVSVDQLLLDRKIDRLDVVKIDVDGGEVNVLEGLRGSLAKYHPHLTIEVHSPELLKGVLNEVEPLGYKMRLVEAPPHEHRPIGFNPTLFS